MDPFRVDVTEMERKIVAELMEGKDVTHSAPIRNVVQRSSIRHGGAFSERARFNRSMRPHALDAKRQLLAGRCPFSRIGYPVDDPPDDRVESLLIERMSAVDAQLGDEVAGDLGHDLVCIP